MENEKRENLVINAIAITRSYTYLYHVPLDNIIFLTRIFITRGKINSEYVYNDLCDT